jgi:Fe-S cluster assembly ATP-binding protein
MNILEVKDLEVKVEKKVILNGIDLALKSGESYVMFGPNGSGKSTLISAIMGIPQYEVASGKIMFMGKDVTKKSVEERAELGMSVAFQYPPEITGVKLSDMLKLCLGKTQRDDFSDGEKKLIEAFNLTEFLHRDINVGFSGGERKRSEILQMIFLKPNLVLLDEPDSGVDVESLKLISTEIERYLEESKRSALIVTHKGDILEYIKAKYACILLEGVMHCFSNPKEVYETIKRSGYKECVACQERISEGWKNDQRR